MRYGAFDIEGAGGNPDAQRIAAGSRIPYFAYRRSHSVDVGVGVLAYGRMQLPNVELQES